MKILITGGCGFIGANLAKHFLTGGHEVVIVDNLSRSKTEINLAWLQNQFTFEFHQRDIRDFTFLKNLIATKKFDVIAHLAGQVAVTTSINDPRMDLDINILGTFNVLEAVRLSDCDSIIVYSSTNKVYGELTDLEITEEEKRYRFGAQIIGVSESQNLDFHSPYGCSKGAADQYIRDYARIYGLRTVCFRQSCIYGYRQFGIEDQGWVAWFIIAALNKLPITVYGNGKQVRDILFIDDLLSAYQASIDNISTAQGKIYNIGGGFENSISLVEFIEMLEDLLSGKLDYHFSNWRPGDQPIYISDNTKLLRDVDWVPKIDARSGIKKLFDWCDNNIELLRI